MVYERLMLRAFPDTRNQMLRDFSWKRMDASCYESPPWNQAHLAGQHSEADGFQPLLQVFPVAL